MLKKAAQRCCDVPPTLLPLTMCSNSPSSDQGTKKYSVSESSYIHTTVKMHIFKLQMWLSTGTSYGYRVFFLT